MLPESDAKPTNFKLNGIVLKKYTRLGNRRRCALSRLEKIDVARRLLLIHLDGSDMEAKALQFKVNSLHNLEAPVPFQCFLKRCLRRALLLNECPSLTMDLLCSVSHNIGATLCLEGMVVEHLYLEERRQRAAVFLEVI